MKHFTFLELQLGSITAELRCGTSILPVCHDGISKTATVIFGWRPSMEPRIGKVEFQLRHRPNRNGIGIERRFSDDPVRKRPSNVATMLPFAYRVHDRLRKWRLISFAFFWWSKCCLYVSATFYEELLFQVTYDFCNFDSDNSLAVSWNCARAFYNSNNQLAKLLLPEGASQSGMVIIFFASLISNLFFRKCGHRSEKAKPKAVVNFGSV